MAQALIVGSRTALWDRRALGAEDPALRPSDGPVGFEFFKPMVELMVETAMLEVASAAAVLTCASCVWLADARLLCLAQFDRDGDGKLSFEEWRQYAEDDPLLLQLVDNLARIGASSSTK